MSKQIIQATDIIKQGEEKKGQDKRMHVVAIADSACSDFEEFQFIYLSMSHQPSSLEASTR